MKHIVIVNRFKIQKSGKKHECTVNIGELGKFSDETLKQRLGKVNPIDHEDAYFVDNIE